MAQHLHAEMRHPRELTDRHVEPFASIGQTAGVGLSWFSVHVPEGKKAKNRFHVGPSSRDWTADVERVLALGATRLEDHAEGD